MDRKQFLRNRIDCTIRARNWTMSQSISAIGGALAGLLALLAWAINSSAFLGTSLIATGVLGVWLLVSCARAWHESAYKVVQDEIRKKDGEIESLRAVMERGRLGIENRRNFIGYVARLRELATAADGQDPGPISKKIRENFLQWDGEFTEYTKSRMGRPDLSEVFTELVELQVSASEDLLNSKVFAKVARKVADGMATYVLKETTS